MKEITDIIRAYRSSLEHCKEAALATVVKVEGSSYRRPGARMLITEDGELTGAISGGCLEGDALRKALLAIKQQQNKLVTYDTNDEDDAKFGVQLGCNGIIYILFEPIPLRAGTTVIDLLQKLVDSRENATLVTLFSTHHGPQAGTCLLYRLNETNFTFSIDLPEKIVEDAKIALRNKCSIWKVYQQDEQLLDAFIEFIAPPVALVIAGAGNDVQPLVEIASLLGWHITVIDGRPTHATVQRFPKANNVWVAKAEEALLNIKTDPATVFVLMTHNYNYDLALLTQLLAHDCIYIGVLGPRKKMDRMFTELKNTGIFFNNTRLSSIFSPVGLDIGAEAAEEIAVSVIAEIKAVLAGATGKSLKLRKSSIHHRHNV